jgi:hypothetical protein
MGNTRILNSVPYFIINIIDEYLNLPFSRFKTLLKNLPSDNVKNTLSLPSPYGGDIIQKKERQNFFREKNENNTVSPYGLCSSAGPWGRT